MHDALYKEVGEYRSRGRLKAGDFSKSSIIRQMFEDGLLVPNPSRSGTNDEKKHRIVLDGSAKYVIKLQREALDD